jgi:hypothetical protein
MYMKRFYPIPLDLKTKQVSPTEVLWYSWCPSGHQIHYNKWVGERGWLGKTKKDHVRRFTHNIFQKMMGLDQNLQKVEDEQDLGIMQELYETQILIPFKKQYLSKHYTDKSFAKYHKANKEKENIIRKIIDAKKNYDELKIRKGFQTMKPVYVELEHLDTELDTVFDTVFEIVENRKQYMILGETKCFSKDDLTSLRDHLGSASLQMRVENQAFKKRFNNAYPNGLLTIISDSDYPEEFRINHTWIKLNENENEILDLIKQTKANRFANLESLTKGECNACLMNGVCELYE